MTKINQKQRAAKAWPILARLAIERSRITYGDLAKKLDIHHRVVSYVLSEIQDYCLEEKLPPLTVIVVNQKGIVGTGFIAWDVDDIETAFTKVYQHPWGSIQNPFGFAESGETVASIASSIIDGTKTPVQAYRMVRARGTGQQIFRATLLKAYKNRCAISMISSKELLEAAHIIPWTDADHNQRLDPCNGILLSIMHHRFYDLGWVSILPDYTIVSDLNAVPKNSYERNLLEDVHGSELCLPKERNLWPNPEFLKRRLENK